MKLLLHKPYLLFWLTIPILFVLGLIFKNEILDINIHDTYFIFNYYHLSILLSLSFAIIGFLYWIAVKFNLKLSNWLTISHIIFTYGGFLFIVIRSLIMNYQEQKTDFPLFDNSGNFNKILMIAALIILLIQVLLPLNIIQSFLKK